MAIDTEKELFEIKKIVEENSKILHSLRRKSRLTTAITIIKWTIIAFVVFGIYSFIQPMVGGVVSSYNTLVEGAEQIKEIKSNVPSFNIGDIFKRD